MEHSHKMLLNTIALYCKIIISTITALLATRIALTALGVVAFGLYNLIAGVIVLLSFFNGALMISTQRFLSIAIGEKNNNKVSEIFNVSIIVHAIFAIAVALLFKIVQPWLFQGFLNIPDDMQNAAIVVYNIMIISSFVTIFSIPYSSIINAREDMCFFSFSEILAILLRLFAAIALLYVSGDLLLIYTWLMLLSVFVGALTKYLWCRYKYKEVALSWKLMRNRELFERMFSFAGWNTLGSVAVLIRNQGVAVLLNVFFGTVVNAAYGIANQVNSLVLTFASTLTTVFTPTIIQSQGEGNEQKMLFTAKFASKVSFLLSSIIALPLLVYMPQVLNIWLVEIPENTIVFCRLIIVAFIILQLYPGINRAIYAKGIIKNYQIVTSLLLIAIIPVGVLLFKQGYPVYSIMVAMVIFQIAVLLCTVYYAKKIVGMDAGEFLRNSVLRPSILFVAFITVVYLVALFVYDPKYWWDVSICSILFMLLYLISYFYIVFNFHEKKMIYDLCNSLKRKFIK